jgi:hypothetical protein
MGMRNDIMYLTSESIVRSTAGAGASERRITLADLEKERAREL